MKITAKWFVENIPAVQQASKHKGVFTLRKGFYYKNGGTTLLFEHKVKEELDNKGIQYTILESGEHYTGFRGGAPLAQQSHWYVKLKIIE